VTSAENAFALSSRAASKRLIGDFLGAIAVAWWQGEILVTLW